MALFTLISRVSDALPLSASIENEDNCNDTTNYQKKAKEIVRKISPLSPQRCSIIDLNNIFHYSIVKGICILGVFDLNYPKRAAFSYLQDLESAFMENHPDAVSTPKRPYYYIEFSTVIQKIKKCYQDSRYTSKPHFNRLNDDLQDVHRIMFESIDEVLKRGELIDILGDKASQLKDQSVIYKSYSQNLYFRQMIVLFSVIFFLSLGCFVVFLLFNN